MYRREHHNQLSFQDFFLPFGGQLSGDNRWIKLANLIPWDELEDDYAAHFCWRRDPAAEKRRMQLERVIALLDWMHSELDLIEAKVISSSPQAEGCTCRARSTTVCS
jgi:transposase, IS5 family